MPSLSFYADEQDIKDLWSHLSDQKGLALLRAAGPDRLMGIISFGDTAKPGRYQFWIVGSGPCEALDDENEYYLVDDPLKPFVALGGDVSTDKTIIELELAGMNSDGSVGISSVGWPGGGSQMAKSVWSKVRKQILSYATRVEEPDGEAVAKADWIYAMPGAAKKLASGVPGATWPGRH